MSPLDYKAHLAVLRKIRTAEQHNGRGVAMIPGSDAEIASPEYRASMAVARSGLLQRSGDNWTRLTPYGREYLAQREG